ncbi:MAG: hypothetical protein ACREQV_10180, partial [Candidatus Binatia bacterium]
SGAVRSTGSQPAISGGGGSSWTRQGADGNTRQCLDRRPSRGRICGRHLDAAPLRCDLFGGVGHRGLDHGRDGMAT